MSKAWALEEIYETSIGGGPRYRRYHADLFARRIKLWAKHQMELEIARTPRPAAPIM